MSPDLKELLVKLEVDPQGLRPEAQLEEAGLDSLALAEMSVLLSEQNVGIGEDELAAAATLDALDRMVADRLSGR
ncbi:phosphopantetheine-binding protein [Actinomadura sp. SCN-SB]|uniref:phosphopantetheine-binding protein n=1 Tax=Actinomadura sp. SCN-SB TaxID=3373092 RepID=UPI00375056AF